MNSLSTEMHPNLRNCIWCAQEFHPITLIPRILTTCGHTFCTECMTKILFEGKQCPLDQKEAPNLPYAQELPIDTRVFAAFPASPDLCPKHNKPLDLICLNEFEKRCIDCKDCLSRRHHFKSIRDVEAEAEEKKKALKSLEEDFESKYDEIDTLLDDDHQEALLKEVENQFKLFQAEIEKTKDHISSAIKRYFEIQKGIADESYNHDDQLRNQARNSIEILNKKDFDHEFFNILCAPIEVLTISSQKPRIDAALNALDNHTEAIRSEILALLARLPSLMRTKDGIGGDFKVEENGVIGSLDSMKTASIQDDEDEMEEEIIPHMEIENNDQKAVSLFYAEIEENNRLNLSFKNQQIETENILSDLEKLKTISAVTLTLNKSKEWKEAIECLQWIWDKLAPITDLKIDFSFKINAREMLETLIEQSDIWATADLSAFTIDLSATGIEDLHIIKLYETSISRMTNIEKLEIILENTKITDHSIQVFAGNIIPNLTWLNDFRFYVDFTKITDDAMEILLTSIHNKQRNLIGFALGLDETEITDRTLENIAENIGPLVPELIKLDISANNTTISDNGLEILTAFLDHQPIKLKEFTLDLGRTKISNESLKLFAQNTLPKMTCLETFELFVDEQKKTTNKTIRKLAKNLNSLTCLKKICLEFCGTDIGGKALAYLEEYALKNKPVLETFELYIAETKLKEVEINDFLVKIEKDPTIQNLKNLSLCFSKLNLTDETCKLLAQVIQNCGSNLQILHIQLGKTNITDKGLISLSEGLYQALQRTKITEFQLYLDSTEVTDEGLKVFSNQVVRSLEGIKTFELYLTLLQGVTDQGVETLFTDLATVAGSLRKIDISLHETRITDNSFKALSQTLWNVRPKLESVALSFGKNENITDESLECCLSNFAPVFHNLKSLTLSFEETKVGSKTVHLLKQYLKKVPSALEKLEIEVGDDVNLKKIVQGLENHLI